MFILKDEMKHPHASRFLIVVITLVLSACSFSLAEDITPPPGSQQEPVTNTEPAAIGPLYPLVPPNPEGGQELYIDKCASCHGVTGQGDGPQASQLPNPVAAVGSAELARRSTPADWYTQVTRGNLERFMPPFPSFSDRQRWDVVAYVYSLSAPASDVTQGAELFQTHCASCHGERGQGDGPGAAGLSKPPANFTDQAFMAEKSAAALFKAMEAGVPPNMPGFGDSLTENDRWALVDFVRTLSFALPEEPVSTVVSQTPVETSEPLETTTEVASAAQGTNSVTGEVIYTSGDLPLDLVVTLHGYDDMSETYTQTTTLQQDSSFVFQDVEMHPGRFFLVTVEYDQTTYGSDIGSFQPNEAALDLPVAIYETTTDRSILSVDRLHLILEFVDERTLRVGQLFIISNLTDETLVAADEGQATVNFILPEEATGLEIQDGVLGGRFIQTPDGFGDTLPVRPSVGNYQVLFSYEMPYDRRLELVQPLTLPVGAVVILIPEGNVKIVSDMLKDGGTRDVQGMLYHVYNGENLAAGSDLRLTITGNPVGGGPSLSAGSDNSLAIGLVVFGVALIVTGVWLFRRSRLTVEEAGVKLSAIPPSDSPENVENLMDAILALDDLFQAGQLPEEAYRQRRAELKARLGELMK